MLLLVAQTAEPEAGQPYPPSQALAVTRGAALSGEHSAAAAAARLRRGVARLRRGVAHVTGRT